MKRQCLQKRLFSGFIFLCISLSFSISTFAAAFTGAYMTTEIDPVTGIPTTVIKDSNPSGQTYTGQNVIEINAYNNAPTLTNNTFNGSTEINPDFTSITSSGNKYNGSVEINYDGLGGTLDSNGDRFQSTTVTAESSDISISNGTFNGTTNINAQSVSLGSVPQMDSLLQKVTNTNLRLDTILDYIYILFDNLANPTVSNTQTRSISYTAPAGTRNISYNLFQRSFDSSHSYYFNFSGLLIYYLNQLVFQISVPYNTLTDNTTASTTVFNLDGYPVRVFRNEYTRYSYNPGTDVISTSLEYRYTSFYSMIGLYFQRTLVSYFTANIAYIADTFYRYYYPRITPESNYFWYVYNTDTAQMESVNLGALMYDISWYLGQMYVLQSASQSLDNMADQVEEITDTLEEAEQKENAVISSISSGINNFAPDIQSISAFRALSWCSNYLQQMYVALGVYGTVIMVGLLLGVCMQFIGYFRYK